MKTKIIVTLGPATKIPEDLIKMRARGVDFTRVNMSHSSLEDLKYFIDLSKKAGIPLIIDTQGSQIRSGDLSEAVILKENEEIKIYRDSVKGNRNGISLIPGEVVAQLEESDTLRLGFNGLILQVADISA